MQFFNSISCAIFMLFSIQFFIQFSMQSLCSFPWICYAVSIQFPVQFLFVQCPMQFSIHITKQLQWNPSIEVTIGEGNLAFIARGVLILGVNYFWDIIMWPILYQGWLLKGFLL